MELKINEKTLEGKIAQAIWNECSERFISIDEFCEAYGFTPKQFKRFLQDGINTGKYFREMDNYYKRNLNRND